MLSSTRSQNQPPPTNPTEALGRHVARSEQRQRTWWEEPEFDAAAAAGAQEQSEHAAAVSFSDIVADISHLLRECVYWLAQAAVTATWVVIWVIVCLFLAAWAGGRGPAAPLAEASGGGWRGLFERLDIGAAKLKEEDEDVESRRRREKALGDYGRLCG